MQEKIIEDMKHWGEEEDYTKENLEAYETFKEAIEELLVAEEHSKEEILESLKYELKSLEGELR